MLDLESEKAIIIFQDQSIKFHEAEHKYYIAMQTLDFVVKYLGKQSHHYDLIKSFTLSNSFPDTSDSFYNIKMINTERRFNACIDGIIDTIIKIGVIETLNQQSDFSESEITPNVTTTPNMKNKAHKIIPWYSKALFKHYIWPVAAALTVAFIIYLIAHIHF
jgi:hypothetical protein